MKTHRARSLICSSLFGVMITLTGIQVSSAKPPVSSKPKIKVSMAGSPIPEDKKKIILDVINYYRALGHLAPIAWNDAISTAAYKHSRYRVANEDYRENPHNETSGRPEFTATNFFDRTTIAGYTGIAFAEGIRKEPDPNVDPAQVVKVLMQSPYHRLPFYAAGPICMGIGQYQTYWTFDFGGLPSEVSSWPVNDATRVPRSGTPHDTPEPMRVHGTTVDDAGYVVSTEYRSAGFKFKEATITDPSGVPLKIYVNQPQNDPFCAYAVIMIPAAKLAAHTTYKCHVAVTTADGEPLVKDWHFTTGDDNDNFDLSAPKA